MVKKILFITTLLFFFPLFAFADGSQTFTSSGTFTVPSFYTSLTVTVNGAGGGGGGGGGTMGANRDGCFSNGSSGTSGGTGGTTSFGSSVPPLAYSGTGGTGGTGGWLHSVRRGRDYSSDCMNGTSGSSGSGGNASGGDTNTTGGGNPGGGGGAGGTGGRGGNGGPGGAGGAGGQAVKTWNAGDPGAPAPGQNISITISGGGGGGTGGTQVGGNGGAGGSGSVTISWSDPYEQTFSSNGTFTVPAGVTSLSVSAIGGGGGGSTGAGYDYSDCGYGGSGAGGGAGATLTEQSVPVTPGSHITVQVGGGGYGGSGCVGGCNDGHGGDGAPGGASTLTDTLSGAVLLSAGGGNPGGSGGGLCGSSHNGSPGAPGACSGLLYSSPPASCSYSGNSGYGIAGSGAGASNGGTAGSGSGGLVEINWAPATPTCTVSLSPNPTTPSAGSTLTYSSRNVPASDSFYINTAKYVITNTSQSATVYAAGNYDGAIYDVNGNTVSSCSPNGGTLTVTSAPTATISADSSAITVGQSTGVHADFMAGSGDTLTGDNIDSPEGTGLGATTNPDAHKDITFTPSSAGTYTFYARIITSYYPSWTSYTSTAVTVSAPSCTPSYSCSGQIIEYQNAQCQTSALTTCTSPSYCSPGSSVCLNPAPAFAPGGNLSASPGTVQKGKTTTLTWNVANVSSCQINGTNGDSYTGAASSGQTTGPITAQTIYTILCRGLDGSTLSGATTVNLVPGYLEI